MRVPWLIVGLIGGTLASFLVSRFESILTQNISLAFFLPLIVYMSDAVGTQTETIFVRNLAKSKANFLLYSLKEIFIGAALGIIFGIIIWLIAYLWIRSVELASTVGLAMLINVSIAPVIAIIVPEIIFKERADPALGAGPFTTIVQDIISIVIYFTVASIVLFH
ncbi:MAG: magnesium transporter [Candidatus Woykebacteria bacterium]